MVNVNDIIISILFINTLLLSIGTIIFVFASFNEKKLISYLPIYIFFLIGNFFVMNQFVDSSYRLVGNTFFMATTLSLLFATCLDYYVIFIKSKIKKNRLNYIISVVPLTSLISSIQVVMIFVLIVSSILLLNIYLKTRSAVKLLFMFSSITPIAGLLIQLNLFLEFEFRLFLSYIFGTVYITILVIIGLVAMLEQEIRKTMSIKDNLKDKYSHELGNILQTLSISHDLIISQKFTEKELINLHNLLKDKLLEASDLVRDIRKL